MGLVSATSFVFVRLGGLSTSPSSFLDFFCSHDEVLFGVLGSIMMIRRVALSALGAAQRAQGVGEGVAAYK